MRQLLGACKTLAERHQEACIEQLSSINAAAEVNLDFDTISHALIITAIWPREAADSTHALRHIDAGQLNGNIEIGVLAPERADEPEELKLGGYLTVLGESRKPCELTGLVRAFD